MHFQKGRRIYDLFLFNIRLEALGKWFRQLLAESLGKGQLKAGLVPMVSVGPADLHSVGQLYLAGLANQFTTFVFVSSAKINLNVPKEGFLGKLAPAQSGKEAGEISAAIFEGVKRAYGKRGLPFVEIELSELSPFAIGEFMQFKMIEVVLLAKLLGVNAYDQPNVELYKEETRKILEK